MKLLAIIFISLTLGMTGYGQDMRQDSLLTQLDGVTDNAEKSLLFSKLGKAFQYSNRDTAIYYAEQGLMLARQVEDPLSLAENSAVLGDLLIMEDRLDEARANYTVASQKFLELNKDFDFAQISMILGNISLAQNNFIDALKTYQKCLNVAERNEFEALIPHLYNNVGVVYMRIDDFEEAKANFKKSKELFDVQGDGYSSALSLLNIAEIHALQGSEEKALNGYLDVIRLLHEEESWTDIASIYNNIAVIYLNKSDLDKASEYLHLAESTLGNMGDSFDGPASYHVAKILSTSAKLALLKDDIERSLASAKESFLLAKQNSYKDIQAENAELISDVYDILGNPDSSLTYLKTYVEISSVIKEEASVKELTKLKMQHEFDAMLQQKELEDVKKEAAHRQKEILYIGAIVFTLLLALILILLYLNQKSKASRATLKKENLELEKKQLSQELNYKNKELATNMMYLLEKNEFITSIAKKLSELKTDAKKSNQMPLQQLVLELKQNASTSIWEEFELRFKEVHSEFYQALNSEFPDLTPNEKKLCAFLRLNMTTKEISALTHQSVKSINMARFRLRKKMNIERDENLIQFLAQLKTSDS